MNSCFCYLGSSTWILLVTHIGCSFHFNLIYDSQIFYIFRMIISWNIRKETFYNRIFIWRCHWNCRVTCFLFKYVHIVEHVVYFPIVKYNKILPRGNRLIQRNCQSRTKQNLNEHSLLWISYLESCSFLVQKLNSNTVTSIFVSKQR